MSLVYKVLCDARSPTPICHHIQELNWFAPTDILYCRHFLHHTLHTLRLHLPHTLSPTSQSLLFRDIYDRTDCLRFLQIKVAHRLGSLSPSFVALIQHLPLLETFVVTNARLSSEMVHQLSQLPHLHSLESTYTSTEDTDQSFPLALPPNPFPSLTSLTLTVKIQTLAQIMFTQLKPFQLKHLRYIASPLQDHSDDSHCEVLFLPDFLGRLRIMCPSIERLHLDLISYGVPHFQNPPNSRVLNLSSLQPLHLYTTLTELTITYDYQLSLDENELRQLLRCWPKMTYLSLNPHPTQLEPPRLTLNVLSTIGIHCPKIKHVGLLIDARPFAVQQLPELWKVAPIPSLCSVDLGFSKLVGNGWQLSAGAFIASVCPNVEDIKTDVPWRGKLAGLRTEATGGPLIPIDRDEIADMEIAIRKRAMQWISASRHLNQLHTAMDLNRKHNSI